MSDPHAHAIEALFEEQRTFPPPESFRRQANWNDPAVYQRAAEDYEKFWAGEAARLDWDRPWDAVLLWDEKTK